MLDAQPPGQFIHQIDFEADEFLVLVAINVRPAALLVGSPADDATLFDFVKRIRAGHWKGGEKGQNGDEAVEHVQVLRAIRRFEQEITEETKRSNCDLSWTNKLLSTGLRPGESAARHRLLR